MREKEEEIAALEEIDDTYRACPFYVLKTHRGLLVVFVNETIRMARTKEGHQGQAQ